MANARNTSSSFFAHDIASSMAKIIDKLEADLYDFERVAFLEQLLDNPATAILLPSIADEWQLRNLHRGVEIEKQRELVKLNHGFLKMYQNEDFAESDKIERQEKIVGNAQSKLEALEAELAKCSQRALTSLELFGPILSQFKHEVEDKWQPSNSF